MYAGLHFTTGTLQTLINIRRLAFVSGCLFLMIFTGILLTQFSTLLIGLTGFIKLFCLVVLMALSLMSFTIAKQIIPNRR